MVTRGSSGSAVAGWPAAVVATESCGGGGEGTKATGGGGEVSEGGPCAAVTRTALCAARSGATAAACLGAPGGLQNAPQLSTNYIQFE